MPKLFNEIKNKSRLPKKKNMIEKKKIAKILFVFLTSLILKKNIREDKALISTSKILAFSLAPPSATM